MNDTPNLSSILDTPTSQAERPRPIPTGSYIVSVLPDVTFGTSSNKGTDYVQYKLQVLDVFTEKNGRRDVDEQELEDMGGIGNLRPVNVIFYITTDSAWRHAKFLDHLGIPDRDDKERDPKKRDLSHRQRALMAPGCQVLPTSSMSQARTDRPCSPG